MAVDHRRTSQHAVGSIRSFFIEIGFDSCFRNYRLTGQVGFVDLQGNRLQQFAVGRYFFTGFQQYDIAYHYILAGYFLHVTVTYHLDQRLFVDGIQQVELLVGIVFEEETDTSSQQDSSYDTNGFGILVLDYRNDQREQGSYK